MQRFCPLRAQQRAVVAPPGVLEPPIANSAISYPLMQMILSEPPPARQFDNGSLSLPSEPAFQVVVKNTFIDVVERSPRSASRSQSEPPRFMKKDLERKPRCLSEIGEVADLFGEQQSPISDSVTEINDSQAKELVTKSSEVEHSHGQQLPGSTGMLKASTPPAADVIEVPQAQHLTDEQHLHVSGSTADVTNPQLVKELSTGEQCALLSSPGAFAAFAAFPAFTVRNTFIEVCQNLPVPKGLRTVRSAAGRLDQLATDWEAIHQVHG